MDFHGGAAIVVSAFSGATACFWGFFAIWWTKKLLESKEEADYVSSNKQEEIRSLPFHVCAYAYMFLTALFYGFNSAFVVRAHSSEAMKVAYWVIYAFYISASNFVGMSFTMGIGTLRTHLSQLQIALLIAAGLVDFLATFLGYIDDSSVETATKTVVLVIFVFVLVLGFHTLHLLTAHIEWSYRREYRVYYSFLLSRRTKLAMILLFCSLLFLVVTIDTYFVERVFPSTTVAAALWSVYAVLATVINMWILRLMKPASALYDFVHFRHEGRQYREESLQQMSLNGSE